MLHNSMKRSIYLKRYPMAVTRQPLRNDPNILPSWPYLAARKILVTTVANTMQTVMRVEIMTEILDNDRFVLISQELSTICISSGLGSVGSTLECHETPVREII